MSDFADEDVVRLRAALGRISRLLDRQVSGDGMTRTQLSVLGSIARLGPLGASELAELEGINPTMLSRILAKLEDRGLVRRSAGALDRRAIEVSVTASGAQMHTELRDERARLLCERLDLLPCPQSTRLLAALPALETLAAEMSRDRERKSVQA